MSYNIPQDFDKADPLSIKVIRIEPELGHHLEVPYQDKSLKSQTLTKLMLYLILEKKSDNLVNKDLSELVLEDLFATLQKLKELLEILMKKDISQNYLYAESLSKNWHFILDHVVDENRKARPHSRLEPLKTLIQTLHTYPLNAPHSLGYYLTQFTGESWLPLPFTEILYHLHEEAILNPPKSHLKHWIQIIDNILQI